MKPWKLIVVCLIILLSPVGMPVRAGESGEAGVTPEVLLLVDPARNRSVPVAIYQKAAPPRSGKRKLAIISHG